MEEEEGEGEVLVAVLGNTLGSLNRTMTVLEITVYHVRVIAVSIYYKTYISRLRYY